jgi:hypothetical protein
VRIIGISLLAVGLILAPNGTQAFGASLSSAPVSVQLDVLNCDVAWPQQLPTLSTAWKLSASPIGGAREQSRIAIPFVVLKKSPTYAEIEFSIAPGAYELFTDFGLTPRGSDTGAQTFLGSNFIVTVLPGEPRHLIARTCDGTTLYDSHRTIAGSLPGQGFAVTIETREGQELADVDGDAYYIAGIGPGQVKLHLYRTGHREVCYVTIPGTDADTSSYQAIRFDISWSLLGSAASGGPCNTKP